MTKLFFKNIFSTVYHLFITIDTMSSSLVGLQCIIVFIVLLAKVTKKSRRSFTMNIFYMSLAMTLVRSKASATQTTFKAKMILYYVVNYLVFCALQEWISHEDTYNSIQQIGNTRIKILLWTSLKYSTDVQWCVQGIPKSIKWT